jgi:hypothetical protein
MKAEVHISMSLIRNDLNALIRAAIEKKANDVYCKMSDTKPNIALMSAEQQMEHTLKNFYRVSKKILRLVFVWLLPSYT